MLGFRCSVPVGFIPIVVCLGVFAGCAHGPLPPQAASRPQWVNPATPGIAKHPAIQADSWNPAVAPREWRHIVIHHTASPSGSVPSIHEAHLKRGWDGIGYHFLIGNGKGMEDGEIEPTFRWREQMHGAHAGKDEYNQHGIGICLVGNFQESSPSSAQLHAVRRLVATLKHTYGISTENVIAHRDVRATACPGKNFPLAEIGTSRLVPVFAGTDSTATDHAAGTAFAGPQAFLNQQPVVTAEGGRVR